MPRTPVIAAVCAVVLSHATVRAQSRPEQIISVGPNVQISMNRSRFPHYEHLAGAHASDPNKMMACSMATDPALGRTISVVYTTVDGGATWRHTLDADLSTRLTGDPVCVYGQADPAYFLVLSVQPNRMFVYRSADAGLTWTRTADMPFIDRENLVVDETCGKYNGRIYINGTGQAPELETGAMAAVTLFRSTDGGRTFSGPALRAAPRRADAAERRRHGAECRPLGRHHRDALRERARSHRARRG